MKIVFVLTQGQASVERGFSINKSMLEDNITEAYIVSHRLVKDYLTSNHLEPKDVKISQDMLLSVKSARQKYMTFMADKKSNHKIARKIKH